MITLDDFKHMIIHKMKRANKTAFHNFYFQLPNFICLVHQLAAQMLITIDLIIKIQNMNTKYLFYPRCKTEILPILVVSLYWQFPK